MPPRRNSSHTHSASGSPSHRVEYDIEVLVPGSSEPEKFTVEEFSGERCAAAAQPGLCLHCYTNLYDDADPFLSIQGTGWRVDQLAVIIGVHRAARELGIEIGRDRYKYELLKLLGAQPREVS